MKVALVYDRVNKWGGAERVLLALKKIFPNAPLFTSVYEKKKALWAEIFDIRTSFLQHIPFLRSHHELVPFLMPFAFESFSFDEFDLVISVTSESAKGILTKPHTKHICICLTPTRYLWSGYEEYFSSRIIRFFLSPLIWYLRKWDEIASSRPDEYIAISQEVSSRIKKYYRKKSNVIYPPVILKKESKTVEKKEDYFLVVSRFSRFTQYKRIDLAIKAAKKLSLPLVVVGEGGSKMFGQLAGPKTHFVGKVSDAALSRYYENARALIFPGFEDFGLTMVEALAHGTPVIAYGKGGALEIVEKGKTGTFFPYQTGESLTEALKSFNDKEYNSATCKKYAEKFSEKRFREHIQNFLAGKNIV